MRKKPTERKPVLTSMDLEEARIVQVGKDLYRVNVRRKSLLQWFASLGDVTVTEDGRVIFPQWMLPAVRSLFTQRAHPSLRQRPVQPELWEKD